MIHFRACRCLNRDKQWPSVPNDLSSIKKTLYANYAGVFTLNPNIDPIKLLKLNNFKAVIQAVTQPVNPRSQGGHMAVNPRTNAGHCPASARSSAGHTRR